MATLIAAQTVGFGCGLGGWILRGRQRSQLLALRAATFASTGIDYTERRVYLGQAQHITVARDKREVSLFCLRSNPKVVLVDLQLLPGVGVDPILQPPGKFLGVRLSLHRHCEQRLKFGIRVCSVFGQVQDRICLDGRDPSSELRKIGAVRLLGHFQAEFHLANRDHRNELHSVRIEPVHRRLRSSVMLMGRVEKA